MSMRRATYLKIWFVCVATAIAPLSTRAAEMETGAIVHYSYANADPQLFDALVEDLHVTSWRSSLVWASIEQKKGIYALPPQYASVVDEARLANQQGMRPLVLLGYGNPLYEAGGLVTTEEARAGFAAYVHWVATQLKGVVHYYEIWNEWNIGFGSTTDPHVVGSVEDYAKLIHVAATAIHEVDPEAQVIAGGATNLDTAWFESFAQTDALSAINGVSIHPYNYGMGAGNNTPEASMGWVDQIEQIMAQASGHSVDMYVTEIGWPTHSAGITEETAGEYLTRFMNAAKASGYVRGVWWYDLIDDGSDPANREDHFGLYHEDGSAKPAATSMRAFNISNQP